MSQTTDKSGQSDRIQVKFGGSWYVLELLSRDSNQFRTRVYWETSNGTPQESVVNAHVRADGSVMATGESRPGDAPVSPRMRVVEQNGVKLVNQGDSV